MTRSTNRYLVVLAALVAAAAAIPGAALPDTPAPRYAITDLGDLGGAVCVGSTGHSSSAAALNEVGQVVGSSCKYQWEPYFDRVIRPFLWSAGTISEISLLDSAASINDVGQVVGGTSVWSNGTETDLGPALGGFSSAYDINNNGQIVGIRGTPPAIDRWRSYLYDLKTGTVTDLGNLGGTFRSTPQSINDTGHVAGWSSLAVDNGIHAFLWKDGTMTDLGGLSDDGTSYGLGINASDQVVGHAAVADGDHAFLWSGDTMTDLGTLGGDFSSAVDINDSGVAVGYALTESNAQRAVIWENGVISDLNDLIPAHSGWRLTYAVAINNAGQIVGNGETGGEQRAFLLTMPPSTSITGHPANPTKSTSATFTFEASGAVAFECRLNGGTFHTCVTPQTYVKLDKRSHLFEVRATAMAGTSAGLPASFAWANGGPPKASITPKPALLTNSTAVTFRFTSTDPGATFECSIDGGPATACTSPENYTGLGDGRHTFAVAAADAAGRKGKPARHTWTIDTTPPDTTIAKGPPASTVSTRAKFKLASTEKGSKFECSLDDATDAACKSAPSYNGLAAGAHTLEVRAIDPAGNTDPSPAAWSWTIE